jgi:hypothetical protein
MQNTTSMSTNIRVHIEIDYPILQQQQQQLSLLSQASWGRLEMKPTENKNKKHKRAQAKRNTRIRNTKKGTRQKEELGVKQKVTKVTVQVR